MRNDELYIDNELVDLDNNTKITLKYKSNLFTDISKIVSNSSYTIKLPNTVHNQKIIDHADLPAYNSNFPWNSHRGRYFRNGVEILKDSLAILLSVSNTFDISLNWGNSVAFNKIVQDAKQLNELSVNDDDFVVWDNNLQISDYNVQSGTVISKIDLGLKEGESNATYHPSVRVSNILSRIQSEYGVTFNFPQDRKEFIDTLLIPCLSKEGGEANRKESYCKLRITNSDGNTFYFKSIETGSKFDSYLNYNYYMQKYDISSVKSLIDGKVVIKLNLKSKTNEIGIFYGDNGGYVTDNFKNVPFTVIEGEYPYFYNIPFEFDIMEGQNFAVGVKGGFPTRSPETDQIEFSIAPKELKIGDKFPIIENLPTIKQIDFIKAICAMCGLFANPSDTVKNQIDFLSMDDIYKNKSRAKDWTHKVVASYKDNKPKEMTFTLSNFAQNNILDYKEDDTVIGSHKGNIKVSDVTLDNSRDILKLPFAASNMKGGLASIPIYSYQDDGTLEYSNVEPRILIEQNNNGKSKSVFTGLDFDVLINRFYDKYMVVVNTPKIVKDKFELSEFELKELDVSIPIYLAQYGKFYAIVSIKAEDTGICECELLQL